MAEETVQGNAKPGAYPNADRANIFGTLLLQFYQNAPGSIARCEAFNGMLALTFSKWRRDYDFMVKYDEAKSDRDFTDPEQHTLTMEMCRVMDDIGTWDWQQEELEVLTVP